MSGDKQVYDIAIIGTGPAGLTSAIYAARRKMHIYLIGAMPGGTATTASLVENYPGFKSISGLELMQKIIEQVEDAGINIGFGEVREIRRDNDIFELKTDDKLIYAKSVIIATGSRHIQLGVKGESRLFGRGVSYCVTCDAPLYKGKTVAVIGEKNKAFLSAITVSDIADTYLIVRKNIDADEKLVEKVKNLNIKLKIVEKIISINGKESVEGITVLNMDSTEEIISLNGVFVEAGETPSIELATRLGLELEKKFIKVDKKMHTSIPGVFAAGDVVGGLQQIVTACGEGAIAAISAYNYVKGLNNA